jgi:hypothetical protein
MQPPGSIEEERRKKEAILLAFFFLRFSFIAIFQAYRHFLTAEA